MGDISMSITEQLVCRLTQLSSLLYHGSFYPKESVGLILPTSKILWRNTLFVSSVTGLIMIIVVLALFFWSTNRQTQIRKITSQGSKSKSYRGRKRNDSMNFPNEPECVEDDEEYEGSDKSHSSGVLQPKTRGEAGGEIINKKEKVQDLMDILSKIKVFSYLNPKALKEVIATMEYIDLPRSGMQLLNGNGKDESPEILDGSLYVVLKGEVTCSCEFSKREYKRDVHPSLTKLTFVAGEGEIATSLLAMLSGLVREYQQTPCVEVDQFNNIDITAISSKDNTRLIRVSPKCFVAMLEKFPHDVHQIIQTILARTQRVTIQTLVKSLGLSQDDIQCHRHSIRSRFHDDSLRVGETFKSIMCSKKDNDSSTFHDVNTCTHDAAVIAAMQLGANTPTCIDLIQRSAKIVSVPPGSTIIESGKKSQHLYLVLDGQLEVGYMTNSENEKGLRSKAPITRGNSWRETAVINTDNSGTQPSTYFHSSYIALPGDIIGKLACLTGDFSTITVRANSNVLPPTIVLEIPTTVLNSLLNERPSTLIECLNFILAEISPVVHLLDWGIEWLHVQTGDVLASKGQHCDCLYVVLNGRLMAGEREPIGYTSSNTGEEYSRGMCIGDSLVIAGSEWPDDLFAIRNSELAKVPLTVLEAIVRLFPDAGLHFAKVIANRVHQKAVGTVNILPSYALDIATVAIVPLQPNSVTREELANFSELMAENLGSIAPCKLMTKSIARKALGEKVFHNRSSIHDVKMARMLGDTEENYRLTVYQTDTNYTRWTKLCLQHADCVLIIVRSDEVPKASLVEQYLSWAHKSLHTHRVNLVVLRPVIQHPIKEECIPVSDDINDWSEKRPWITRHHLVRIPFQPYVKDMQRMCRRITGCSLGLVLGGGGARGIAHLGVIRALDDVGITVDMVGGTSQGAFIGALYAKNPDDFDELIATSRIMANGMASIREKVLDLTFPLVSYFNGSRFNRTIMECVGQKTRIQDLLLSFFCVSTDINEASQRVHTKGTCWKYVRASMSLTGYLPPISEGGSLLLDGGYTNLVPGDVMLNQMGARTVIAVDVSPEDVVEYYDYGSNLSGLWLLYNSLNPFVSTVRVPSMGDLSQKLMWVSSVKHHTTVKENFDLLLIPPVHDYGTLEYDKFDEIYNLSYKYAKPVVEKFLKDRPYLAMSQK